MSGEESAMIRPIAVEARKRFRIWLRYSDGAAGEIDLSHVAGRGARQSARSGLASVYARAGK